MEQDQLKQQLVALARVIPALGDAVRAEVRDERIEQVKSVVESLARLHGERVSTILVELSGAEIQDPDVAFILTSAAGDAMRTLEPPAERKLT